MKITIDISKKEVELIKKSIDIGWTCVSIALQYRLIQEINKL